MACLSSTTHNVAGYLITVMLVTVPFQSHCSTDQAPCTYTVVAKATLYQVTNARVE